MIKIYRYFLKDFGKRSYNSETHILLPCLNALETPRSVAHTNIYSVSSSVNAIEKWKKYLVITLIKLIVAIRARKIAPKSSSIWSSQYFIVIPPVEYSQRSCMRRLYSSYVAYLTEAMSSWASLIRSSPIISVHLS